MIMTRNQLISATPPNRQNKEMYTCLSCYFKNCKKIGLSDSSTYG